MHATLIPYYRTICLVVHVLFCLLKVRLNDIRQSNRFKMLYGITPKTYANDMALLVPEQ